MAIIIITHDLGVVAEIADEICVMYAGRIVERASTEQIFAAPQHPYTWGLLKSIPRLDSPRGEELVPIAGRPPSLINRPTGCHFHPRCRYAQEDHQQRDPKLEPVPGDPGHSVACLLEAKVRNQIWSGLQAGKGLAELEKLAGPGIATTPPEPLVPDPLVQADPAPAQADGSPPAGEPIIQPEETG
jgi:peptide/nickel transport system ATP-binding protein